MLRGEFQIDQQARVNERVRGGKFRVTGVFSFFRRFFHRLSAGTVGVRGCFFPWQRKRASQGNTDVCHPPLEMTILACSKKIL